MDHCHAGNNPDICIFTQNAWPNDHIVRPPDDKIEYSIEHYEKVFKEHKIKGISAVGFWGDNCKIDLCINDFFLFLDHAYETAAEWIWTVWAEKKVS